MSIRLPKLYLTSNVPQPFTDKALKLDEFARTALETYRTSYNPLPTCTQEFAAFFSKHNYDHLYKLISQMAGNKPESNELYEAMMWAYSSDPPRSFEMDDRRDKFGPEITGSYVKEINELVIDKMVAETVAANKLWDHYAKYRNGPIGWIDDSQIDTRTRLNSSRFDMTYDML